MQSQLALAKYYANLANYGSGIVGGAPVGGGVVGGVVPERYVTFAKKVRAENKGKKLTNQAIGALYRQEYKTVKKTRKPKAKAFSVKVPKNARKSKFHGVPIDDVYLNAHNCKMLLAELAKKAAARKKKAATTKSTKKGKGMYGF